MPRVRRSQKILRLLFAIALGLASGAGAGEARLLDGRVLEGALRFNGVGELAVQVGDASVITVPLTNLARATFASGSFFSGGSTLPNGWTASDLGDARGFARVDTNTFTFRVEGQNTNVASAHFVSRPMTSDGEIFIRVDELGGTGAAQTGVMIRAQNSGVFAALSLGRDGRVWFERRSENGQRAIQRTPGPSATVPVWLRLQLKEKKITALVALDGKKWETLATEPLDIGPQHTWRESEGELRLLRASAGVFASSREKGATATARVSTLLLIQNGLVGEYFADREFANLKMARFDPQIRFDWSRSSPDAALPATNFSVRWTGKIRSRTAASYTFHLESTNGARLWIDRTETPLLDFQRPTNAPLPPTTPLMGGLLTDFKLEFEKTADPATVKLGWALPYQKPEIIGLTNFFYYFTGAKSPESIALARLTNAGPVVRGVVLRNGTFLAAPLTRADESAVRLAFAGRPEAPLLNNRVARLVLRPPRQELDYDLSAGRGGVFLANGDFFECEFRGLEHRTLTVSSVLFGLKKYRVEDGPLVVVLNDLAQESGAKFEVRLLDGSVLRARSLRAAPDALTVTDSILGDLAIPLGELVEIRQLDVTPTNTP